MRSTAAVNPRRFAVKISINTINLGSQEVVPSNASIIRSIYVNNRDLDVKTSGSGTVQLSGMHQGQKRALCSETSITKTSLSFGLARWELRLGMVDPKHTTSSDLEWCMPIGELGHQRQIDDAAGALLVRQLT